MLRVLAQSTTSSSSSALPLLAILIVLAMLGWLVGKIAQGKGDSFGAFWLFGVFFFVIALIVVLVLPDKGKPGPPAALQAQIVWTHSGTRYLLGYTVQNPYYGVWDRQQPGPPVQKFPYNEHGKSEALAWFARVEPNSADVGNVSLPPPPSSPKAPGTAN